MIGIGVVVWRGSHGPIPSGSGSAAATDGARAAACAFFLFGAALLVGGLLWAFLLARDVREGNDGKWG